MSANEMELPAAIPCGPTLDRQHCQALRENFQQRLAAGETELALDLRETTALCPSAIYLVLAANKSLAARGGRVTLLHLSDQLKELLTSLGLGQNLGLS